MGARLTQKGNTMAKNRNFTPARRWAAETKRKNFAKMTEGALTPDEARTAIMGICMGLGYDVVDTMGYDPSLDVFTLLVKDSSDSMFELTIPGESVANTVAVARTMVGVKQLVRLGDAAKIH